MHIIKNIDEWLIIRGSLPAQVTLGFVPTMGNLHAGHSSLVRQSKLQNELTVVSIFINPTQFNKAEDLQHYPRTLDDDLALLTHLGIDYCLLPNEQEIYADNYNYQLQELRQSLQLEGKHRPGHFTGVLTVVMRLLNLVRPHNTYFGEKDYQQYQLIKGMVAAFFMDTVIKLCPTVREASGLAYSSRNNRLSPTQRLLAEKFAQLFHQQKSLAAISQDLQVNNIDVEYLEEYDGRRFIAVLIGDVRLIDNYALKALT